jgi:hypothetical protein
MAKIHFNKALQLDPEDPMAQAGKQQLEGGQNPASKASGAAANAKASPSKASSTKKPDDKAGGGLFGLFGGKKK